MINKNQIEAYLKRISFQGELKSDHETLQHLHKAHMQSIPFENLDIPLGQKIRLDFPSLFEKIIANKRGGFCYELNYLFSTLLAASGFKVKLLAAQVYDGDKLGKPFDHQLLLVVCENNVLIADVGFGDSFISPLKINSKPEEQRGSLYKAIPQNEHFVLMKKNPTKEWQPQYQFSLNAHQIEDFTEMCDYQQSSPESNFTKKSVCSRATDNGRITLSNNKLINTRADIREENSIENINQYRELLIQHFGITLPAKLSSEQSKRLGFSEKL
ncbi:MAG: arylamine N-acetyltransferase [Kangiellaceae bacterium]|nr:arylamine N-acetyltransferase [Kangiellaceae bacterium]